MFDRRDIIYLYDGTFDGLLTAVFDSFKNHEIPMGIEPDTNVQQTLGAIYCHISTDTEKAYRVEAAIREKISHVAMRNIYFAYLSYADDKEMKILAYIHRCFKYGKGVNSHLNDKYVAAVLDAVLTVTNEAHKIKGFVRFSELESGVYYSQIEPRCRVLPCLIHHFSQRYVSIPFIIHDLTHKECLVYNGKECNIYQTDIIPKVNYSQNEQQYRDLWCEFYKTVEISQRHNEKCRMTNMPKRYWKYLTEMNA